MSLGGEGNDCLARLRAGEGAGNRVGREDLAWVRGEKEKYEGSRWGRKGLTPGDREGKEPGRGMKEGRLIRVRGARSCCTAVNGAGETLLTA